MFHSPISHPSVDLIIVTGQVPRKQIKPGYSDHSAMVFGDGLKLLRLGQQGVI